MEGQTAGGRLEVHAGSADGPLLGTAEVKKAGPFTLSLTDTQGMKDLYLVYRNENAGGKPLFAITDLSFQ